MLIDVDERAHSNGASASRRQGALSRHHPGRFADSLREHGFAGILPADWGTPIAETGAAEWDNFARSWERLGEDRSMGDGGHYRRRRFAAYSVDGGTIARKPHQAHFQSRQYNRLNGGRARWFLPVEAEIGAHEVACGMLRIGEELANAVSGWACHAWHAELHQFRIDATQGVGRPTPEGSHRDGVTAVLMMLVGRRNICGGVTTLSEKGRFVCQLALTQPLQAIALDDARLCHSVSPVTARTQGTPAWRDMLVITFRPDRSRNSTALLENCNG